MRLIPKTYSAYRMCNICKMKTISLYHGYIAITDYRLGDNPGLEKAVSVWDDSTFKYVMKGAYYVKSLRELRVNRGFDTAILTRHLKEYPIYVVNETPPTKDIKARLMTKPRDGIQKMTLAFMACSGPYTNNEKFTQQLIACDTGDGKTYCGVASTCFYNAVTLVIVPFDKLIGQWKDSYTKFTTMKEDEIMVIKGMKTCDKVLNKETKGIKVYIAMIETLQAFNKNRGDLATSDLLRATGAKIKIIDEVHRNMASLVMVDSLSNFKMNFYMSASPGRTDAKENVIFERMFKKVPRFGQNIKRQEEKHLNIFVKKYDWLPNQQQLRACTVGRKRWLNSKLYEAELLNSKDKQKQNFELSLRQILSHIKSKKAESNKVLILCETIDGTEYLKAFSNTIYGKDNVSTYYGKMKAKDKQEALTAEVICATSSSLGTGADIRDIQFVINIGTYSSAISAIQIPGRARKLDGYEVAYIELVNFGFEKTIKQFQGRRKVLETKSKTGTITIID